MADRKAPGHGASLFHATVAQGLAQWVLAFARRHALRRGSFRSSRRPDPQGAAQCARRSETALIWPV